MKFNRASTCHTFHLTSLKKHKLDNILKEYAKICNYFISTYEQQILENKTSKLQFLYAEFIQKGISETQTWFSARMMKNAYSEAYSMIQSAKTLSVIKKKKYIRPVHYGLKAIFSETIASASFETTISFDSMLTLSSIGNKQKIQIPFKRHKQFNKWFELGCLSKSITLFRNKIQFSFEVETDKKVTTGKDLGIDIGLNKLIATSDKETIGSNYKNLLEKLDRKKKNSKAYTRCKHEIESYIDKSCKLIPWSELKTVVVEKLKNVKYKMKIRQRLGRKTRRFISNWSYRRVLDRIRALSEENRVSFRSVPAYYTSQTCPECSHRDKKNRKTQECFVCQSCGYTDNADFVGAQNILNLFLTGPYCASCQT